MTPLNGRKRGRNDEEFSRRHGRIIKVSYADLGDNETCVIKIALVSGLMLLFQNDLNRLFESLISTGELIFYELNSGYS